MEDLVWCSKIKLQNDYYHFLFCSFAIYCNIQAILMVCMSFAQTLKINGIQAITSNGAVESIFRETLRNFWKLSFIPRTIISTVKCHLNFDAFRNFFRRQTYSSHHSWDIYYLFKRSWRARALLNMGKLRHFVCSYLFLSSFISLGEAQKFSEGHRKSQQVSGSLSESQWVSVTLS